MKIRTTTFFVTTTLFFGLMMILFAAFSVSSTISRKDISDELARYKLETEGIATQLVSCQKEVEITKGILGLIKPRFMEEIENCEWDCEE